MPGPFTYLTRPRTLRWHVVLLVIAVLLPVVAFSSAIGTRLAMDRREAAQSRLIQNARELADSLDREMESTIRALDALGETNSLESGRLGDFHTEAARVVSAEPSWWAVVLTSGDGQPLVNTTIPWGQPLPPIMEPQSLQQCIETQKPAIGSLARGTGGQLAFPIRIPVFHDGKLRYILTAVIKPAAIDRIVRHATPATEEFTRGISDTNGTLVARTVDSEKYVGQKGNPQTWAVVSQQESGFIPTRTVEGHSVYSAFTHTKMANWLVGIAAPIERIDGPLNRSVFALCAGGLAMLIISGLLAAIVSRHLAVGITAATKAADALAHGGQPSTLARTSIIELEQLGQSLKRSGELLADRDQQLRDNLAEADSARAQAESANRAKDEFLAMLGHELRNPLAPIRMGAELLAILPTDDPEFQSMIQTIQRQSSHMARIVDDLLDASRVARGKVRLELRPLDLRNVVREVETDLRPQFDTAKLALEVRVPDQPVIVDGDRTRLAQCLGNLLHNAQKYTPAGGHVRVHLTAGQTHAHLSVSDDGVGMEKELLERIFETFSQGPQNLGRLQGGLGLGLAIVRGMITLHNGSVAADSPGPDQGSTFTVTLPIATNARLDDAEQTSPPASKAAGLPAQATRKRTKSATPRKVLIVEDLHDAARMLMQLLNMEGHDVRVAHTAAEALATAIDFAPQVVICDIGLPDMDGYELCRRMRRTSVLRSARLIALTGYGQNDDVARATEAGFDLHLTKPVNVGNLCQAVASLTPTPAASQ